MVAYAIAVCSISPSSFSQSDALEYTILQLHIGEHVEVHATSQGWCYGCTESDLFHYGIFPQACIVPICKPSSTCTEEVHALVAEMTEVLDEWWISIKDIYGKQARMDSQDEILSYIEDLMTMRKKFLSGNVPVEELREMRLELSKKIDLGNHWLGLDMIIRNEIGEPIDIDGISVIRAYREHKTAASRIARDSKPSDASVVNAFSLLVHAQSATLDCRCECEFSISLYDVTDQRFISETFVFDWSHGSLTNRNSKALFNDLGASEYPSSSPLKRDHHIVMCIRVARVAPIDAPSATVRKQSDLGPPQTWSRQPYAAAVLDLTSCIRNSPGPQEFIVHLNREDSLEQILAKFNPSRPSIQPKLVIGDANSSCTGPYSENS
ncbi:hypothetical protein AB6A40_007329 [Gnathostoma spinigerum]|uniref:Dedicator of cytokinesis N-terminal domain-containing protein n=1 Tax=Gnathostoma spinigerum TaxID=75299 RepID=A0ABD6EM51_9BILA